MGVTSAAAVLRRRAADTLSILLGASLHEEYSDADDAAEIRLTETVYEDQTSRQVCANVVVWKRQ